MFPAAAFRPHQPGQGHSADAEVLTAGAPGQRVLADSAAAGRAGPRQLPRAGEVPGPQDHG